MKGVKDAAGPLKGVKDAAGPLKGVEDAAGPLKGVEDESDLPKMDVNQWWKLEFTGGVMDYQQSVLQGQRLPTGQRRMRQRSIERDRLP